MLVLGLGVGVGHGEGNLPKSLCLSAFSSFYYIE